MNRHGTTLRNMCERLGEVFDRLYVFVKCVKFGNQYIFT